MEIYACPVCHQALTRHPTAYRCPENHTYDIAKSGYVNLVLANQKRTKNPGYNKEMIQSRRHFFAKGYYDSIAPQLIQALQAAIPQLFQRKSCHILDVGCADGYLSHQIHQQWPSPSRMWGIDLSKVGVQYAAQRYASINFAVANIYRLPILPSSVDLIIQILAPTHEAEYARILKKDGYLVTVTPNTDHLWALKSHIYETPRKHQPKIPDFTHFTLLDKATIHGSISLDNPEDIQSIFRMTPYYWRASEAVRERVGSLERLETAIDLVVSVYKKGSTETQVVEKMASVQTDA